MLPDVPAVQLVFGGCHFGVVGQDQLPSVEKSFAFFLASAEDTLRLYTGGD